MKGKFLLLMALCFALSLGACQKKPKVTAPPTPAPPAPTPAPPPEPEPEPPPMPAPPPVDYFQQGEGYFDNGDYTNAIEAYEKFLSESKSEKNHDRAHFRLALSYVLPGSPPHDPQKGMTLLKRFITQFPESPLRTQAQFVLDLQSEIDRLKGESKEKDDRIKERNERIRDQEERIKRLTSELEKLKKIDLERRPSRPPQ